jgi:hypothetical protein
MKVEFLSRLLAFVIVLFLSGPVSAEVSLEYLGAEGCVSFKIENKRLKEPLIITGKETDGIYYETDEGKLKKFYDESLTIAKDEPKIKELEKAAEW